MSIIHIQKRDNPYAMIDKRPLENQELSWRAKGLLCYLLSKPGNWNVCIEDLIQKSKEGKAAVYAVIKELETAGHIVKHPHRADGRILKWVYDVFEEPRKSAVAAENTTSRISRNRNSRNRNSRNRKSTTSNNEDNSNNELSKKELMPAEADTPQVDTPVLKKESKEEVSHQDYVDAYWKWYEAKAGNPPRLLEQDYKALKNIRKYLTDVKKGDTTAALQGWLYILNNWAILENFLQKQVKPTQIDSNMANILLQIRQNHREVAPPEVKVASMAVEEVEDLFGGVNPNFKEPTYTPKYAKE
jgi:hypothetical protein